MAKEVKSQSIVIKDPLLDPYYIKADDRQFSLHKAIPSGHEMQAMSYHADLGGLIKKVTRLKTNNLVRGQVMTLEAYIGVYSAVGKDISEFFKSIEL